MQDPHFPLLFLFLFGQILLSLTALFGCSSDTLSSPVKSIVRSGMEDKPLTSDSSNTLDQAYKRSLNFSIAILIAINRKKYRYTDPDTQFKKRSRDRSIPNVIHFDIIFLLPENGKPVLCS